MANVVTEELIKLIDKELEAANKKFGLNHSNHESFAVLREEIDEAEERIAEVEHRAAELWQGIKKNDSDEATRKRYTGIWASATQLAIEAIQIAAMARKGLISNIDFTENKAAAEAGQDAGADAAQPVLQYGA